MLYHTMTVLLEYIDRSLQFSINSLTLVHYPTTDLQKGQDLLNCWSRELLSSPWTKWFECRKKFQPSGDLNAKQHQCRLYRHACMHATRKPHTNGDEIFLCILPYLNISDFSWLGVYSLVTLSWLRVCSLVNYKCINIIAVNLFLHNYFPLCWHYAYNAFRDPLCSKLYAS